MRCLFIHVFAQVVGDFHVNHGECSLVLLGMESLQFQDDPKIFPGDDEILMEISGVFFGMEKNPAFFFSGVRNIWYDWKSFRWHYGFTAQKGF